MTQDPEAPPGVIPYVDAHDGPRRPLIVRLTTNGMVAGQITPVVGIDGRRYVVYWGVVSFDIPADRSCHVSVHCEADRMAQATSMLLTPGAPGVPVSLVYATHVGSGQGSLNFA